MREYFSGSAHKGWKYYQGVTHNTYHDGNIETDQRVICSMPEDVSKYFLLPSSIALVSGTLIEVLDNITTTR